MSRAYVNTPPPISERDWQRTVLDLARRLGWRFHHETNSFGTAAGHPDLELWRPEGFMGKPGRPTIYAELKRQSGTLSPAQQERIDSLRAAGNVVFVWRPSDWDEVVAELER